MSRISVVIAGRPRAVRFAMWAVANDGGRPVISVDLLAP